MKDDDKQRPWYREPWPWVLIAIPAAAVIWSIFLIIVSFNYQVSMVEDDYYDEGMGINRELSRDVEAASLGLTAEVDASAGKHLDITLNSEQQRNWDKLKIELLHPTLGDRDQSVTAQRTGAGQYRARIDELSEGRWYLDIRNADNEWRLKGELELPREEPLVLKPIREARANDRPG
ncbi:hypothetical protein DES49_2321 [Halospina denitrificans]|uniref:Nitrogen fixation protein FixH n=1 Tax=Halospina denitrificans TaxID=332522 RepID=A0A4R7JP61_9GAMM|nr:FixH family protein [Halospina denitrificans]TDT39396.1 hypothetical protein DES49_2321 [Halospina denitrificans]